MRIAGDLQEDCRGHSGGALWTEFEGDRDSVCRVESTGICGIGVPEVPLSYAARARSARFRAVHDVPPLLFLSFFYSGNDFPCPN